MKEKMEKSIIPFVSVIIPTYNMGEMLKAAIESLFKQTYHKDHYEIIVVNNSSTDNTEGIVQALQANAPIDLKYYCKKNEGPGTARNYGILKARGNILAFTDSDCVADPQWIEKGVAKMKDGIGLVQGKTLANPNQERTTFSRTQEILREDGNYQTCNMFYRKNVIDDAGGFSTEFCGIDIFGKPRWGGEDTDLGWRVKKSGWKSIFADDAVVYHLIINTKPWKIIVNYEMCRAFLHTLPYLFKKHPELRRICLYRRFFLKKITALFILFLLSVLIGIFIHPVFLILTIPYTAERLKNAFIGRPLKAYHRGFIVLMIYFLKDIVGSVLLICGSIRHRSIVL